MDVHEWCYGVATVPRWRLCTRKDDRVRVEVIFRDDLVLRCVWRKSRCDLDEYATGRCIDDELVQVFVNGGFRVFRVVEFAIVPEMSETI